MPNVQSASEFRHTAHEEQFYLASRTLSWWLVGVTFAASWFGASSTLVTLDALVFRGWNGLWDIVVPSLVSCGVIALVLARRVALWCRHHGALSMAEAVGMAFGLRARWGVAVIIVLATVTMLAAQLVAAGQAAFGLWHWSPAFTMTVFASIILTYSLVGGYRAVVVTDVGQLAVILLALATPILLLGLGLGGGLSPGIEAIALNPGFGIAGSTQSLNFPAWGTPTQWATALTFVLGWMVAPEMWQRMQSLSPKQDARQAALWGVALLAVLFALVATLAWLAPTVLTITPSTIELTNGMPPLGTVWAAWVSWASHPLAQGGMVLGLLCAIASTMDSCLNVGSMILACDVVEPLMNKASSSTLGLNRWAMLVMMGVAVWIALMQQDMLHVLWLSADFYASVMALPVLVLLWYAPGLPPASVARAGGWAMVAGALATLVLRLLGMLVGEGLPPLLQWPWTTLWAIGLSLVVFAIGSTGFSGAKPLNPGGH